MLEVSDITVFLQRVKVLRDISFNVGESEIVAVIGPNGSGKTTLLRTLSGLVSVHTGSLAFMGQKINGLKPHQIVRLGISQIPERGRVFPHMTVLEHLQMGAWTRRRSKELNRDMQNIYDYFPILAERKNQMAGTLSGGERQMIAIARALMSRPKMLILDEPTLGLAPLIRIELGNIIKKLNQQGTTILLVEQDALMALSVSHRGYVLETGRIVLEGNSTDLLENENVRKAYLGME